MAAALVGAAIETAGTPVEFSRSTESPRAALRRIRPALILVDCRQPDACGPEFLAPALMTGATIAVFGARRDATAVAHAARRFGVRAICLPGDEQALLELARHAPVANRES